MRIIVTGGGTAGHINPALAIANYIKNNNKNHEIFYVGNKKHMEYNLVKSAGFDFIDIEVEGLQRKINLKNILRNINSVRLLFLANLKAKKILTKIKPDIVIGTGGYVTGPILNTAAKMGIRTFTHEQNAYPGMTTKLLSKKVNKVLLAVPEAQKFLDEKCHVEIVGNPIRQEILMADRKKSREKLGISKDQICILSFGGSLGAQTINKTIANLLLRTVEHSKLHFIHATGKSGFEKFNQILKQEKNSLDNNNLDNNIIEKIKNKKNIDIREYINNMDECLAAADIVISRSGAITLSELQAAGKASILIPSPHVAENHQYHNAMVLANNKAAIVIQEKDLNPNVVYEKIINLVLNPEKILNMSENAKKLAVFDSCKKIYDIILKNN